MSDDVGGRDMRKMGSHKCNIWGPAEEGPAKEGPAIERIVLEKGPVGEESPMPVPTADDSMH
jgi:hypothetical protein